jgi:YD repeat-containing protein
MVNYIIKIPMRILRSGLFLAMLFIVQNSYAQTFKYKSSEASGIRTAAQLHTHGLPDTITVWCNEWDNIMASPTTWGNSLKLKSNHAFVKFYVDNYYPKAQRPFTYQLTYQIYGYTNPADTTVYTLTNDTLTITSQNNADPLNAYQDINLAKFSNYYKTKVVITNIINYNGGSPVPANLADTTRRNFNIESTILTQRYDKPHYGVGTSLETSQSADPANNFLLVSFNLPGGTTPVQLTPVNFELEWTYIDDYKRDVSGGTISSVPSSGINYEFTNNCTRVWLDSSHYRIPLVYPNGYIVYRVRMVRPDSSLFKFPVYSDWSYSIADGGNLGSLIAAHPEAVYHIATPYSNDSLNWQYTVSFAEGGKYKHVLSFYDGLLKSRESITRFNSALDKLIVTKSVYDYEGRPALKTIPAPVGSSSFSFQHNVDINSLTNLPYRASDFDTGWHVCPGDPMLPPMASWALANKYYSNQNPDTAGVQRYVPDAGGYPMVQTIYSPAFNDRVYKQGGAGPRLQIADSNIITNFYVTTGQQVINRLFGTNIGWNSYYNMTVSKDPNMQLSMSIKDFKGKQIATAMIGEGGNPVTHATVPVDVPGVTYNQEDILYGFPQEIIGNKRIADKDFFNEVEGNDSIRYVYKFAPYPVCPDQYLCVAAHFAYHVTDQCGDTVYAQDSTLGYTGVVSAPVSFSGEGGVMHLGVAPYSVHKELSIDPADVDAAIDTFLKVANCLKTEPWFIRKAVQSRKFPCPADITKDPCAEKRQQMIEDLYPGGTYGGYYVGGGGGIVATWPSIFTWHPGPDPEMPWDSTSYPHYHYQDSCLHIKLPDTIVISGIAYYPLKTMSVDSFIMVYNLAIAAGDNSIAEALLPLHPEYCLLLACVNDTFKTYLQAIPNHKVAEKLHLLHLDSIIAHDPLLPLLGGGTYADSLATFPGGLVRLDLPMLVKAYCGCGDTVMMRECVSHIFNYEITNRLLINDQIKQTYFTDIVELYLRNRQRYVGAYALSVALDSCAICDTSRLPLLPGHEVFDAPGVTSWGAPGHPFIDSPWTSGGSIASWLLDAMSTGSLDSALLAEMADSASTVYSSSDSAFCYGQIDTIMVRLSNCANGSPAVLAAIRNTLDSLCAAHAISMGNFTPEIIRYAITANGATPDDFCNQYLVNATTDLPGSPGSEGCMTDTFYAHVMQYLNDRDVNSALRDPGVYYEDTLDPVGNQFQHEIYGRLGGTTPYVKNIVTYNASLNLYTLKIFNNTVSPATDTVRIYLHSTVSSGPCAHIFGSGDSIVVNNVDCISTVAGSSVSGLINEYGFVARITAYSGTTYNSCVLLGWTDTVETMVPRSNPLKGCIPCTQMRELYNAFIDTITAFGVKGVDHPLYDRMLLNFMNTHVPQSYSLDQYERFIQSCALADSMKMPLYVGYSNLKFATSADADAFIAALNAVDTEYNFDGIYRDSSATGITVCVDLSIPSPWNLHTYRTLINSYGGSFTDRVVNARLDSLQGDTVMGFIYAYPGTPIPPASTIFGASGTVSISASESRGVWMGTHYVPHDFYYVRYVPGTTPPHELSKDAYELTRYFWNNGLSATFVSNFRSTVNKDYFKPRKKEYLSYTYHHQQLPPYEVLDSVQAQYLEARIPGYSGSEVTYAHPFDPGIITNLYLGDASSSNQYLDTLIHILQMVQDLNVVNPGHIFFDTNKVVVIPTVDSPLIAYRCSDGSYWYRYFGNGDTLYNVYVDMPAWIPRWQHPSYSVISVGPPPGVVPALGDSTTRFFTLNLYNGTDTIQARGMTTFVIGRNTVLKNVLLGQPIAGYSAIPPSDTFNNCERHRLNSAIRQGVVDYHNYIDSLVRAVKAGFIAYMLENVQEQLIIGYQTQQFGYTLYYYDRAGNLCATVPPAGVHSITGTALNLVDTVRKGSTPIVPYMPGDLIPAHTKVSSYHYNSINQVADQKTPDAGETRFFYDAAGRLICSQNAKQAPEGYCTYNLYDRQNRIIETGEAKLLCPYFDEYEIDFAPYMPDCYFSYPGTMPGLSTHVISSFSPVIRGIKTMPHDSIILYIHSIDRRDVVCTIYDTAAKNLYSITGLDAQENLRKRVSCTKYFRYISALDTFFRGYDYATHYSYDLAGNVKTLVQDYPALDHLKQRYKRVDYDYDLISGKVNMLSYNRSFADQYYQRYTYDDDNRIQKVETSGDGLIWDRDAEYKYYQHGPLARIDIGELRVQGIDYAYTVQGWLKIMNSDTLDRHMDMGGDASATVNATDAAMYSIDYFANDYKPITASQVSHVQPVFRNLYNGNISRQTMAMANFARLNKQYVYDQLNRIYTASYSSVSPVDNMLTGLPDYRSSYSYDADGNLKTLIRYGNNTGTGASLMDSLEYHYGTGMGGYMPNQLQTLIDHAPDVYTNDIRQVAPTAPPNYTYDRVGNTTKDLVSGQDTIKWNLYNKVTETRNNTQHNWMHFDYGTGGERVGKYFTQSNDSGSVEKNEYYVRDAQGNILAIYREDVLYKLEPISWVSSIHDLCTLTPGLYPMIYASAGIYPMFAGSEEFAEAIMKPALISDDFRNWQLDRSPSYFLSNSQKLYTDVVAGTPTYVMPLVAYEQAGSDSILSDAMKAAAAETTENLNNVVYELLGDSAVAAHMLDLFCYAGADSLISHALGFEDIDSFIECDSVRHYLKPLLGQIAADDNLRKDFAYSITVAAAHHLHQFNNFLDTLATDTLISNHPQYSNSAKPYVAYLQEIIYGWANHSSMLSFFDKHVPAIQLIYNVANSKDLLNIVYRKEKGVFLYQLDSALGTRYIDTAVAAVPGIAPRPYAMELMGLLHPWDPGDLEVAVLETMHEVMKRHNFDLAEHDIYGTGCTGNDTRVGVRNYWLGQKGLKWDYEHHIFDTATFLKRQPWYSGDYQDMIRDTAREWYGRIHSTKFIASHITGQKQYELTENSGINVLATVIDARNPDDTTACAVIDYYKPTVKSAYDHYPFGMYMPGRYTNDSDAHCTTISETVLVPVVTPVWHPFDLGTVVLTGSGTLVTSTPGVKYLLDPLDPVSGTEGVSFRIPDLTIGEAQQMQIAFGGREGTMIFAIIDSSGGQYTVLDVQQLASSASPDTVTFYFTPSGPDIFGVGVLTSPGTPITDIHLGGYYTYTVTLVPTTVISTVCSEDEYRYDFNTQMKNNEWAGVGNHYTALYWEYDSRIGRRANIDPKSDKQPWLSPYAVNGCSPIELSDPNGDFPLIGAAVGFVVGFTGSVASQAIGALISGDPIDIDWGDATFAGGEGAWIGSGVGIVGIVAAKATGAILRTTIDIKSSGAQSAFGIIGDKKSGKEILIDGMSETFGLFVGSVGSYIGDGASKGMSEATKSDYFKKALVKGGGDLAANFTLGSLGSGLTNMAKQAYLPGYTKAHRYRRMGNGVELFFRKKEVK